MSRIAVLVLALSVAGSGLLLGWGAGRADAATCTPTGFVRDSINLTAKMINPPGTVSGDVDATGCNIGIYYDSGKGTVKGANVHNANYFGIVVNGDANAVSVDVLNSSI